MSTILMDIITIIIYLFIIIICAIFFNNSNMSVLITFYRKYAMHSFYLLSFNLYICFIIRVVVQKHSQNPLTPLLNKYYLLTKYFITFTFLKNEKCLEVISYCTSNSAESEAFSRRINSMEHKNSNQRISSA